MENKRTSIILVIDDEPNARMALEALLEGVGYHIEMAENGMQGLQMARELQPDLILLDVMMPGVDGYEVCRQLRDDPQLGEVPIFMITALDDRNSRLAGLSVGADDFLSKPFDRMELQIRLNTLKRVDRYRNLLRERAKLQKAFDEINQKNQQLRALSRRLLNAQENERRSLALELHDEIGQLITGLKLILEKQDSEAESQLREARVVTDELFQRVRQMSLELRPSVLDDFGLGAALTWLIKRFSQQTGIKIGHNIDPLSEQRFDKGIELSVFRVVQEALTNIARHAEVKEARVTLNIAPDRLKVSIIDTGRGFDIDALNETESSGVSGMAERVEMLGGSFLLISSPGQGTKVNAEFELSGEG